MTKDQNINLIKNLSEIKSIINFILQSTDRNIKVEEIKLFTEKITIDLTKKDQWNNELEEVKSIQELSPNSRLFVEGIISVDGKKENFRGIWYYSKDKKLIKENISNDEVLLDSEEEFGEKSKWTERIAWAMRIGELIVNIIKTCMEGGE